MAERPFVLACNRTVALVKLVGFTRLAMTIDCRRHRKKCDATNRAST
jgi:hypothetical protein